MDKKKRTVRAKGTGQIIPRGTDKWLVRVFAGKDDNGKRQYVSVTVEGTQKAAQKKLTELQGKVDAGKVVVPEKSNLETYLQTWLREAGGNWSRQTKDSYARVIRLYILPGLGAKAVGSLGPFIVQTWVNRLTAQGLAPRTVVLAYCVLQSAMMKAAEWKVLAESPCEGIVLPTRKKPKHHVLAVEQISAFLSSAAQNPYGTMVVFGLCTGARPGEVQAVHWSDLDLDAGTWMVQHNLVRFRRTEGVERGKSWELKPPKSEAGNRRICLPPSLVAMLRQHREEQRFQRAAAGGLWQDTGLVFTSAVGTPPFKSNINRDGLKRILKEAGLSEKTSLKDLRHSLGTLMADLGEHPKTTAEQLGHTDASFTMKTYQHPVTATMRRAAENVEKAVFSQPQKSEPTILRLMHTSWHTIRARNQAAEPKSATDPVNTMLMSLANSRYTVYGHRLGAPL